VTLSIGIASSGEVSGVEALVKLADTRVYAAKAEGRNRVVAMGRER
jgi:PleD family two-component response regulator